MSFSGMRDAPILANGDKGPLNLWFRGRNILDAILQDLTKKYNFGNAEEVMLTGCSAGGLTTFFQADYVASVLPKSVRKYGAVPESGYFMNHKNV